MKNPTIGLLALLLVFTSCKKIVEKVVNAATQTTVNAEGYTIYTIQQGKQYCDQNKYQSVSTSEMKFLVKFDSSAVYQTFDPGNQNDINKLFGYSDNNADHHQFSARYGWRWSLNALHLFAYVYNQGAVISKDLGTFPLGTAINCSIKASSSNYYFTTNGVVERLPRMATTEKAEGYQLYPYFGGDEPAPHKVTILIKTL